MVGYPAWHPKTKGQTPYTYKGKGKTFNNQQRWNKGKTGTRMTVNAQGHYQTDAGSVSNSVSPITAQQLEQLLRMLPTKGGETDDEIEDSYAGMVSYQFADSLRSNEWILDSGASDYMTGLFSILNNVVECQNNPLINLPTGETSKISHSGNVGLKSELKLNHVLHIPAFKQNLLSVNKFCHDNTCKVAFYDKYCIIPDVVSDEVKGIGRSENGLYYLINEPLEKTLDKIKNNTLNLMKNTKGSEKGAMTVSLCREVPRVIKNVPN